MESWCHVGLRAEAALHEDGLFGSRYVGRVLELAKGEALLEFEVRHKAELAPRACRRV